MKLLKEKSRSYNGKDYFKYKINLPEILVRQARLEAGDELEFKFKDGNIILKTRGDSGGS
jgi:hypothetical protein